MHTQASVAPNAPTDRPTSDPKLDEEGGFDDAITEAGIAVPVPAVIRR
jgi:hypothetical protein